MLSLSNVSLGSALKELSFSSEGQSICAVSADKESLSALCDVICGIKKPSSGTVKCGGNVPLLAKDSPLPPYMTVEAYLKTAASISGKNGIEPFVYENAKAILDRRIGSLTRSARTRVGVLSLLTAGAEYVFAELPTEGLDPTESDKVLSLLLSDSHGSLPIYAADTLSDMMKADRVLALDHGRLAFFGAPCELTEMAEHMTETVATLMGDKSRIEELFGSICDVISETDKKNVYLLELGDMTEKEIKERIKGSGITFIGANRKNDILRRIVGMLKLNGERKAEAYAERVAKKEGPKKLDVSFTAFSRELSEDPYSDDESDEEDTEESTLFSSEGGKKH